MPNQHIQPLFDDEAIQTILMPVLEKALLALKAQNQIPVFERVGNELGSFIRGQNEGAWALVTLAYRMTEAFYESYDDCKSAHSSINLIDAKNIPKHIWSKRAETALETLCNRFSLYSPQPAPTPAMQEPVLV